MEFYKYQGCGNDFILVDSRDKDLMLSESTIRSTCDRRFGIGADGFMILSNIEGYHFEMKYFNSDGRPSTFCGNGGRCIVRFARDLNIIQNEAHFIFDRQIYRASIDGELISLKMQDVNEVKMIQADYEINTGSPHYIRFQEKIDHFDLIKFGHEIRYSDTYPSGINVNIIEVTGDLSLKMRTYERGVEDETYSCGTGVVAAAIAFINQTGYHGKQSILIKTKGGDFNVVLSSNGGAYENIYLKGPAHFVFKGIWNNDSVKQ